MFINEIEFAQLEEFISFIKNYTKFSVEDMNNYLEIYFIGEENGQLYKEEYIVNIKNRKYSSIPKKIERDFLPFE